MKQPETSGEPHSAFGSRAPELRNQSLFSRTFLQSSGHAVMETKHIGDAPSFGFDIVYPLHSV